MNKVIVVTGGSGLIGKAIIKTLIDESWMVINLDIEFHENFGEEQIKCDITKPHEIQEAIKNIKNRYNKINGLVNNAYPRTKDWGFHFNEINIESWRKNVDYQLNSLFFVTQQILQIMVGQNEGSIVNMGSIYGTVGNNFNIYQNTGITAPAAYSAIKGGVINLTRYLASLYGPNGIRINCVSPGGVFNDQDYIFVKQYEKQVPLRRMAQPEDISPAVKFLLSDESKYITGHNLIVDGGWTAI